MHTRLEVQLCKLTWLGTYAWKSDCETEPVLNPLGKQASRMEKTIGIPFLGIDGANSPVLGGDPTIVRCTKGNHLLSLWHAVGQCFSQTDFFGLAVLRFLTAMVGPRDSQLRGLEPR
jgi:hypothetical protein